MRKMIIEKIPTGLSGQEYKGVYFISLDNGLDIGKAVITACALDIPSDEEMFIYICDGNGTGNRLEHYSEMELGLIGKGHHIIRTGLESATRKLVEAPTPSELYYEAGRSEREECLLDDMRMLMEALGQAKQDPRFDLGRFNSLGFFEQQETLRWMCQYFEIGYFETPVLRDDYEDFAYRYFYDQLLMEFGKEAA